MKRTIAFLFAFFSSLALAGTRDPKVSDERHLEYGSLFECVAKITCVEADGKRLASASCVIIDPHWIVTAAHVVAEGHDWKVCVNGKCYPIVEMIIHKGFRDHTGIDDIAVGRSEDDFGLAFYPALYGQSNETGKVVSICGYGMTGTFSSGYKTSDGKKRAGSNIVDFIDPRGLIVCSAGRGVATELEFLCAPGDSGGGLFIGNELAGINSIVMAEGRDPLARYGDETGHTRISKHREWINARIGR